MSDLTTAITGAAIGAIAALLGGHITAMRQARWEIERWRRGRQDTLVGEVAAAEHLDTEVQPWLHSAVPHRGSAGLVPATGCCSPTDCRATLGPAEHAVAANHAARRGPALRRPDRAAG